ncbi:MAG: YdcF family protein [Planctomycetota bacterium]
MDTPTPPPPPRRRRWRRLLLLGAAPALLPLGWLVGDGLVDDSGAADVAVVLGNKVHPSGIPSQHLRERLERALALFREGRVQALLVSGGLGREGHQEADVMARWLIERGVPAERVLRDPHGNTTHDTALNAARIMGERGWTRALVISQYFHLTRAKLALRRAGVADVQGAHAELNLTWKEPYSLAREVAGLYYYALRRDF